MSEPLDDVIDEVVDRLRAAGCVLAEEEAHLLLEAADVDGDLWGRVEQRVAGRPLEHILGWARFDEHLVVVAPGVFVPRHRSEAMVRLTASLLRPLVAGPNGPGVAGPVLLDLCCGSGALGLAVVSAVVGPSSSPFFPMREHRVELHAADIDPVAVACASRNIESIGGHAHVGDLFEPLPRSLVGRIDIVMANVPYVPTEAIGLLPAEFRDHESRIALDGGVDGLDVLHRVVDEVGRWLGRDGRVVFEVTGDQVRAASGAVVEAGFDVEVVRDDEADTFVLIGRKPVPVAGSSPSYQT